MNFRLPPSYSGKSGGAEVLVGSGVERDSGRRGTGGFARRWLGLCLVIVSCATGGGQETFRVKSKLVTVSFTAEDAKGGLLRDLARDQVSVTEDGVPQTIAYFSHGAELPLTLGLVVDASGSQDHFSKQHLRDLESFLRQVLRPGDKVFLLCFGNHLRVASDFPGGPEEVLAGLRRFGKGETKEMRELGPQEDRELGTALYDAVFFGIKERLAGAKGNRALLVFSDGEENASATNLMDAIEEAQAENTLLYTIRYTEMRHGRLTARNRYGASVMDRMARETGARSIDAVATDPATYFRQIAEQLRSSYELAYYPKDLASDRTFHKIAIRTTQEGATVHARTGYVAR